MSVNQIIIPGQPATYTNLHILILNIPILFVLAADQSEIYGWFPGMKGISITGIIPIPRAPVFKVFSLLSILYVLTSWLNQQIESKLSILY